MTTICRNRERKEPHMTFRTGLAFCIAALYFWHSTLSPAAADTTRRQPNVVLFLVDDMGWMDCGAYGSKYYETPNIDRLATSGMRFTEAYSANPLCTPTRASILTGQYPARLGITAAVGAQPPLPADAPRYPESANRNRRLITPESLRFLPPDKYTLAEALRDAGYRTGHFGKWHLGVSERHRPDQQGYEVAWHGTPDSGPPGPNGYFSPYSFQTGTITPGPEGEYIVDRMTDEVLKFVEQNDDRPFFASVWHFGVHGPWGHKEEYTKRFQQKKDPRGQQGNPVMASMLQSIDESLGRILAKLDALNLRERTIIVFASDNGGNVHSNTTADAQGLDPQSPRAKQLANYWEFAGYLPPTNNAPLRAGKGTLYEGGIRIPLIVSWPGVVPSDTVSHEIVSTVDFYPTLLDLTDVTAREPIDFDGVSLAPVLKDPGQTLEREALFNFFPHGGPAKPPGVTVRKGRWKLIRWFEPTPDEHVTVALYDLEQDIGESQNLAAKFPEIVNELQTQIDRFLQSTGALVPKPNPNFVSAATGTDDDPRPRRRRQPAADRDRTSSEP